jgi:asparagine synthase (glutamine-hydrolysing)
MAWGVEARVPFLDKAFLEVAMNIDPKAKTFSKGGEQEVDEDGCDKMEKVSFLIIYCCVAYSHLFSQYVLRKAFDCAPDGKVVR